MSEHEKLREELARAYRALHGYHNAFLRRELPGDSMVLYHMVTVAAARRYIEEGVLDGTEYFVGKPVAVLHKYQRPNPDPAEQTAMQKMVPQQPGAEWPKV